MPPLSAVPVPLSHHEILRLVEPFARVGRHPDLAASDRLERRLRFKVREHEGRPNEVPAHRESMQLDHPHPGRYRLKRTLSLADGAEATLVAEGEEIGALLARVEAVPSARQLRSGPGFDVALDHRLDAFGTVRLTGGSVRVGGLSASLRMPTGGGGRADIVLSTGLDDPIELPEDLLAVLGGDWARLDPWTEPSRRRWNGSVRLRGRRTARELDAERKLERVAMQIAVTLSAPPADFHDRHVAARWRFAIRCAVPLLACIALVVSSLAFARAGLSQDSVWRMLIFNAPPLMLVAFFCMRELPRIELPRWPRRLRAEAWRPEAIGSRRCPATR